MAAVSHDNSEHELLRRAMHGDGEAFGDIYALYLEPVYRYVFYRIGDELEAEDLTEIVFLKAWEALPSIRLDGFNFRAWIYRIAHNSVIDRHRTNHPTVPIGEIDDLPQAQYFETPESSYQRVETEQQLKDVIDQLEPNLQNVILFRFILGFSHSETAELMNLTEVYIRVLQHRALKKIKELLSRKQIEDEQSNRHNLR